MQPRAPSGYCTLSRKNLSFIARFPAEICMGSLWRILSARAQETRGIKKKVAKITGAVSSKAFITAPPQSLALAYA